MAQKTATPRKTRVFISYSRKDKDYARKLHDDLAKSGVDIWVDWEDIPLTADWRAEILRAIDGADAFLFLLSPNSLSSKNCLEEVQLAIDNNKKLVPIVISELEKGAAMDPKLRVPNWTYLRPTDDYAATLPKLVDAINTDLEWVQQHTRILQRAREWVAKKKNSSYLLQGSDIDDSERWLAASTTDAARAVTPLQAEYIHASRRAFIERQRSIILGIGLALVVSIALGILAFVQRNKAVASDNARATQESIAVSKEHARATAEADALDQKKIAQRNEIAAQAQRGVASAQIYQGRAGELNISTLLAVDAWQRAQTSNAAGVQTQAEDILRHNLSLMPLPLAQGRQKDYISTINFSADHTKFVTASEDGSACVWKAADGAQLYCVSQGSIVYDAVFGKSDQYLFTAGDNGKLMVWSAADGKPVQTFDLGVTVWALDVSPDDQWLAAGRADGVAYIYTLNNLARNPSKVPIPGEVYAVNFSPDSNWLGLGSSIGTVRFWYMSKSYYTVGPQHKDAVFKIAFSPDSQWAVSVGADSTARSARLVTGEQKFSMPHGDWVEDVVYDPKGKWFATASDDNIVRLWDPATGKEILRVEHSDFAQVVTVSHNGQWLASTGKDFSVRVWDVTTGSEMMEASLKAPGTSLAFSADDRTLVSTDRKGNVSLWNISALAARVGYLAFPEFVHNAVFSHDGASVFVNTDDRQVWKVDSAQARGPNLGTDGTAVLASDELTDALALSRDGRWAAVAVPNSNEVLLQNLADLNAPKVTITHGAKVYGIAFSPDSRWLATAGLDNKIAMWDVTTAERKFDLQGVDTSANALAFSPDGGWLAAGESDQTRLWDIKQRKSVYTLSQVGSVTALRFSADGAWLEDLDDGVRACVCGLSAGRGAQRWTACTQDAGPRHGRQGGQEHEE